MATQNATPTKYKGAALGGKATVFFSDTVRVLVPGTPVQFPAYTVPEGCRAFVQPIGNNAGAVAVANHPRPSLAPTSGGSVVLSPLGVSGNTPFEIDSGTSLGGWFVDAANANEGVTILVTLNVRERVWP